MLKKLIILLAGLLLLFAGLVTFMRYSEFGKRDMCLDDGGVWKDGSCVGNRSGR